MSKYDYTERPHDPAIGGVRRFYNLDNGYGLSAVNSPMLHPYPFAWEFGIIDNKTNRLTYDTPLTDDVVVCFAEAEAVVFLDKAYAWSKNMKGKSDAP